MIIRPVCHTDVWNISSSYVIGCHSLCCVVWSQPVLKWKINFGFLFPVCLLHLFHIMAESTHETRVPGELTQVAAGELEDLSCNAVLLHQRLLNQMRQIYFARVLHLGEVKLEGIVGGQWHIEAPGNQLTFAPTSKVSPCEVVRKRRSVVVEEKGVVGERTHSNANLQRKNERLWYARHWSGWAGMDLGAFVFYLTDVVQVL